MLESKWTKQVPVYLFTGFLESGKTSFIIDSLSEQDFAANDRNLVIVTEKGMTPISKDKFPGKSVEVEFVTDKNNFCPDYLKILNEKYRPEKILIECNGMWMLDDIYNNIPENWVIVQEFTFAEAATFMMYNNNMRNLVFDKLKYADVVAFNRFNPSSMDVMDYHKIVRVANRSSQIVYETADGQIKVDDIEDPLPFDDTKDFIELDDRDYAYWYRDFAENHSKYVGKKMKFKCMITTQGESPYADYGAGRHVMTCCVDDIEFMGLLCQSKCDDKPKHGMWAMITGTIVQGPVLLDGSYPIMEVESLKPAEPPEEQVANYY
ncbi:MAG: GTPase [Firmicutes bacterium]|nr:GTPase [Bacillota bacterium]